MDRISTATDPTRIGDETDPWDEFLDGALAVEELDPDLRARADSLGLA